MSIPLIPTQSGNRVDPFNVNPDHVMESDIVWSLSQQCRYYGHTSRHYSVAEHALHVCHIVAALGGTNPQVRLALHHEDAEAYFSDIHTAIKSHPAIAGFLQVSELNALIVILKKFGVTHQDKDLVPTTDNLLHRVDISICRAECEMLGLAFFPSDGQRVCEQYYFGEYRRTYELAKKRIREADKYTTFQIANMFRLARGGRYPAL